MLKIAEQRTEMATVTGKRQAVNKRSRSTKRPPYQVFISHSSLDKWIAERMAEKIAETGAEYWLDERDLEGGGDIRKEINDGMHDCQEVVVLFSPNSVDSHWVSFEIGASYAKRKHLTPILNNVSHSSITLLQGIKAIELNNFGQYLTELKKRMKRWTKRR